MKLSRRKFLHLAAAVPFAPHVATAQVYPTRPFALSSVSPQAALPTLARVWSWADYIINTSGYSFRKRSVKIPIGLARHNREMPWRHDQLSVCYVMVDDLALARVLHVLAVVHWIGGVAAVTMIVLPKARGEPDPDRAIAVFGYFERRFAPQARISVAIAGLSGGYMLWRISAWSRFELASFWWLHLMVVLWMLFALMLFVLEPLGIDRRFEAYVRRDQQRALALAFRAHAIALLIAVLTIGAGVLGTHGYLP
jgi:uncharacterized membrane protein